MQIDGIEWGQSAWKTAMSRKTPQFSEFRQILLKYYPPFIAWLQEESERAFGFYEKNNGLKSDPMGADKGRDEILDLIYRRTSEERRAAWGIKLIPLRGNLCGLKVRGRVIELNYLDDLFKKPSGVQFLKKSQRLTEQTPFHDENEYSFIAEIDIRTDIKIVLKEIEKHWNFGRLAYNLPSGKGKHDSFEPQKPDFDVFCHWLAGGSTTDSVIAEIYRKHGDNGSKASLIGKGGKRRKAYRNFIDPSGASSCWMP
ncbi:hypothetical protein WDW86_15820 [Bdellovibrionota bacterium FG-2]